MARADSTTSRSTSRNPTKVLVRIGGTAKTASAIVVAVSPKPMGVTAKTVSRASVGTARLTLENTTTALDPRPLVPRAMPTGTATTIAARTAITEMARCSSSRSTIPPGRDQLNGSLR